MNNATLRLKMSVSSVNTLCDGTGAKVQEEIFLQAVYGPENSPNGQWSKWTPCARLMISVSNSAAFDKVLPGQFFFVELIPTTKDST